MHDELDWPFIAYALSDFGLGAEERWRSFADRAGDGKRAKQYGKVLAKLAKNLDDLAEVLADDDFSSQRRRADEALASAIAGPLMALGEDLRAAAPRGDREPAYDD